MRKAIIFGVIAVAFGVITISGFASSERLDNQLSEEIKAVDAAAVALVEECMKSFDVDEIQQCNILIDEAFQMCSDYPSMKVCEAEMIRKYTNHVKVVFGLD